jgi:hypothetical protein
MGEDFPGAKTDDAGEDLVEEEEEESNLIILKR